MRPSILFTTLLATAGLATPVRSPGHGLEVRAAKPNLGLLIGADFEDITAQTIALNKTITGFHKGDRSVIVAYRIRKQALNITATLRNTLKDVKASSNFTQGKNDTSGAVAGPVLDLTDPVRETIDNLNSKRRVVATAVFGVADLSKTVEAIATELRDLTEAIAPELLKRLNSGYDDVGPIVVNSLIGYFNSTIERYKKCTGKICLPAVPGV